MRFNEVKSDTLNLRVGPAFKKTLKAIADRENRSMVNLLECLVIEYCERNGLVNSATKIASNTTSGKTRDALGR